MSAEIQVSYPPGSTLYACVRNAAGAVWYVTGQVFETWGTGGRTAADYDIALTGDNGDLYLGNMDTNIAAGVYLVQVYLQAGGAPADGDDCFAWGLLSWSGTAENQPAFAGDEMALLDDAITSAKFDETTAYPIESPDSGDTYIARTGADGDTLETLSDQIDALLVDVDGLYGIMPMMDLLSGTIVQGSVVGPSA